MMKKIVLIAGLSLLSTFADAQVFNKFQPAAGILVGNTSPTTGYQTAAAASGDIQTASAAGLVFGGATGGNKGPGSVNATALYINGAAVGTSSGAVSSVALSMPASIFAVTGSPVTSAGTLTGSFATGQTANQLFGTSAAGAVGFGNALSPTLTGNWIHSPTSGVAIISNAVAGSKAIVATGAAGDYAVSISNVNTASNSYGVLIQAGTNATDFALRVQNTGGAADLFTVNGSGAIALKGVATFTPGANLAAIFNNSTAGNAITSLCNTSNTSGARCWNQRIGSTGTYTLSTATDASATQNDAFGLLRDTSGNFTGAVIVAPASGTTLKATSSTGAPGLDVNATSGRALIILSEGATRKAFISSTPVANSFCNGTSTGDVCIASSAGSLVFSTDDGSSPAMTIGTSRSVTINAPTSGNYGLNVNGVAGTFAQRVTASTTASQSDGLLILAGTNAADSAFVINDATNSVAYFGVGGAGSVTVGNPTGGGKGVGSINAQALYVNGVAVSSAGFVCQFLVSGTGNGSTPTVAGSGSSPCSAISLSRNGGGSYTVTQASFGTSSLVTCTWGDASAANIYSVAPASGTVGLHVTIAGSAQDPGSGVQLRCGLSN